MDKNSNYFMYFPGNYRWSAAFLNMMSLTPYGASEIGELYKIGQLLKDKAPEDDAAWFDACVKVADGVRGHAERFDKSGHPVSAAHAYLRACNYYQMAGNYNGFVTTKAGEKLEIKDMYGCAEHGAIG